MSTTPLVTQAAFGETRLTNTEIGGQRRTEGFIKFLAEEQQRQNERAAQLLEPARQALRAAMQEMRQVWRGMTPERLAKAWKDSDYMLSITPDLGLAENPDEHWTQYDNNPEKAQADVQVVKQCIADFIKSIPQHTGVVLSRNDQTKLTKLIFAEMVTRNAAFSEAMCGACYNWLWEGECFNDFGFDESLITITEPQQEKMPLTVDDVLRTVDTTTKDGSALLKKVVDQQWAKELDPLVSAWFEHLAQDYSITVSRDVAQYLFGPAGWFSTRGLAINAENLNAARRHLTARGVFDALTTQEQLDLRLQRNEIGRPEYMFLCNRCLSAGVLNRPVKEARAKGILPA
jgi:hypothetical protein